MNFFSKWAEKFSASKKKGAEKRREERVRTSYDYVVEIERKGQSEKIITTGRDVSLEGVRFVTAEKLEKKEALTITFHFSKSFHERRDLSLKGIVVHAFRPRGARRWRIGCRFVSPSPEERQILQDFLIWAKHRPG